MLTILSQVINTDESTFSCFCFIGGIGFNHETLDRTDFTSNPIFNSPYAYLQYDGNFTESLNVIVVPNPYIVHSKLNETDYLKQIRFTHLPKECNIKIYTVTGEFVFQLEHNSETDGNEYWDLRTINNQEVSPGLYIYVVVIPSGETFVDKFAIVR